jgi:hypothetical protein
VLSVERDAETVSLLLIVVSGLKIVLMGYALHV